MYAQTMNIQEMLTLLNQESYKLAISYIQELIEKQEKEKVAHSRRMLDEINAMFAEDKGWDSEEEMLKDLANIRRKREGL